MFCLTSATFRRKLMTIVGECCDRCSDRFHSRGSADGGRRRRLGRLEMSSTKTSLLTASESKNTMMLTSRRGDVSRRRSSANTTNVMIGMDNMDATEQTPKSQTHALLLKTWTTTGCTSGRTNDSMVTRSEAFGKICKL